MLTAASTCHVVAHRMSKTIDDETRGPIDAADDGRDQAKHEHHAMYGVDGCSRMCVMTAAATGVKEERREWMPEAAVGAERWAGSGRVERRGWMAGRFWRIGGEGVEVLMAAANVMTAAPSWGGEVEKRWPSMGGGSRKEDAWRSGGTVAPRRAMSLAADEVEIVESDGAAAGSCLRGASWLTLTY